MEAPPPLPLPSSAQPLAPSSPPAPGLFRVLFCIGAVCNACASWGGFVASVLAWRAPLSLAAPPAGPAARGDMPHDDSSALGEAAPMEIDGEDGGPPAMASHVTLLDLPRLHGAFGFGSMPAAGDQNKGAVAFWVGKLQLFVAELKGLWPAWPGLTPAGLAALEDAAAQLSGAAPHEPIEWLPDFGCAILGLPAPSGCAVLQDELALYVLAPDSWSFGSHSSPAGVGHTAQPSSPALVACASVPRAQLQSLIALMHKLIAEQQTLKVKEKQKGSNALGRNSHFQRTPAFVRAALLSALDGLPQRLAGSSGLPAFRPPRGGFTDVGLHTGGIPRETAWPLVRHALQVLLELASAPPEQQKQVQQQQEWQQQEQEHWQQQQQGQQQGQWQWQGQQAERQQQRQQLEPPELFALTELHFELWLAQQVAQHVSTDEATPEVLSACVRMLEAAAGKAAAVAVGGQDMATVEATLASIRQRLDAAAGQRQLAAARQYQLPAGSAARGDWQLPCGTVPPPLRAAADASDLAAARARAAGNLGALPCLPPGQSPLRRSLRALLAVCGAARTAGEAAALLHALRSVEALLCGLAAPGAGQLASAGAAVSEPEAELLAQVVDQYRLVLKDFQGSPAGKAPGATSHSELRSRAVLVAWVALCLMFEGACHVHPLVREYGAPLDWRDLRHLRLSDKAATDAALAVGCYLRRHASTPLFRLASQGATLQFAQRFAAADSRLCDLLHEHKQHAERRMDEHWQVVQRQQREAAQLRSDIQQLESEISSLQQEQSSLHLYSDTYYALNYGLKAKIRSTRSSLDSKKCALRRAEQAPEAVVQPLPRDSTLAQQWLFFLHMPPVLRHLARMSCLSQQLLLPPWDEQLAELLLVSGLRTPLPAHYNDMQARTRYVSQPKVYKGSNGGEGNVMLYSHGQASFEPPKHIDQYSSREDGVFWPDSLAPILAWQGSGCAADAGAVPSAVFFNPFRPVPNAAMVDAFTEQLSEQLQPGASRLQWMLAQYGSLEATAADRGNAALAHAWDGKSAGALRTWLSRREYVAAARLRAFPLRQAHVLAQSLAQRELPLEQPAVQELVRQAMHHLGELAPGSALCGHMLLQWRQNWHGASGVLEALCRELEQLADELEEKPRAQQSVLLLGELAAFLSEHAERARAVARRFAAMTARYADRQLQRQVDAARGDEAALAALSAKQAQWRSMALLCHRAGALAEADAAEVLRLLVLVKRSDIYQPDATTAAALAALRVRVHDASARRLPEVLAAAQASPQLLTRAAAAVLEWLDRPGAPRLLWQCIEASKDSELPPAAFEAVGSDGRLYSLNALDGTLLVDGAPPGRLPRDVLQHRLYRRVFGDSNHEVVTADGGELLTTRPINGRFYSFRLAPAAAAGGSSGGDTQALVVTEVDHSQPRGSLELELLDPGRGGSCGMWGDELPERLKKMHSHWLNRQHQVIVLRPLDFRRRSSAFLIRCGSLSAPGNTTAGGAAAAPSAQAYACWRVPGHLQDLHWLQLLSNGNFTWQLAAHQLVLLSASRALHVLGKFEQQRFIHAFMPGGCPALALDSSEYSQASEGSQASQGSEDSQASQGSQGSQASKDSQASEGSDSASAVSSGDKGTAGQQPAVLAASGPMAAGCCFHLPRFGLEFVLGPDGGVKCRNYRGYQLREEQLLVEPPPPQPPQHQHQQQGVQYTMPGFFQYLVLEISPAALTEQQPGEGRSDVLVLVPSGTVTVRRGAIEGPCTPIVSVQLSERHDAQHKASAYEMHGRFGHLLAPTIQARLQLAALYAATSSLLPEPATQQTGAQTAMALLRQSWTNDQLSAGELAQLRSVPALGGHLAPGLHLLAHDVEASSAQLQHLRGPDAAGVGVAGQRQGAGSSLDPDAATAYMQLARRQLPAGFSPNHRLLLTAVEERWLLHTRRGLSAGVRAAPTWLRHGLFSLVQRLPDLPVPLDFVARAEQQLLGLTAAPPQVQPGRAPAYPLAQPGGHGTPLEARMHQELQRSWQLHHSVPTATQLAAGAAAKIRTLQAHTRSHREAAQAFLLHHLADVPASVGAPGAAFRLQRLAGTLPAPAASDLLCCSWQPQRIRAFNPFLSDKACAQLQQGVLTWLQLCVLEDRLARLVQLSEGGRDRTSLLVKELLVQRTWDPARHPKWLVFEVEGRLQIRQSQHAVAAALLEGLQASSSCDSGGAGGKGGGPGPIIQLNMGEGKTRVIVPMLALELADGAKLVRLNILSNLLHEGRDHMHQNLTASALGVKVFVQPFHRGIATTPAALRAMCAALDHCQQVGGVLVVAPKHRNSLYLKSVELQLELLRAEAPPDGRQAGAGGSCGEGLPAARAERLRESVLLLGRLLDGYQTVDLLDESDELLHHRHRMLVYAYGESMALPSLQQRVEVVQGLLAVFSRLADEGAAELARGVARRTDLAACRKPGSFCGLELLGGSALQAVLPSLQHRLAEALMAQPPLEDEMGWMRNFPDKALLLRVMCEPAADANALLQQQLSQLSLDKQHQLLAARGLLACGLLAHGLQMRHRVQHGVSTLATASKRLSVPYRGADTPSERSEFSLADVAILLTHLAYYHTGLSRGQFEECVHSLLQLGASAQAYNYKRWLAAAAQPGGAEPDASFDRVEKVDASNPQLLSAMHKFFSHNREAVNFWLATCVLPAETRTYPSRLAATAWHLAHSTRGAAGGFSGTKDNAPLLPSAVEQVELEGHARIAGTDGLMLALLLQHAQYSTLELPQPEGGAGGVAWQALLDEALRQGVDALVDCGAMLAGVDLRAAAQYVLDNAPSGRFSGATFFDTRLRAWVVLEATSGSVRTKAESNVRVADTFVIFDDPRCRGADHKLRQHAVALLTLAPQLPKDKLMQAAGRMRQLGRGQELRLVGTPDVTDKIVAATTAAAATAGHQREPKRQRKEPDVADVLEWVVANTAAAVLGGVVEHSAQGMHFATTAQGAPAHLARLPERLELDELFGGSRQPEPASAIVSALAARHDQLVRSTKALSAAEQQRRLGEIAHVQQLSEQLAAGHSVVSGHVADEECERELEQEEEQEQERETEVPVATPAPEADWDYARAFTGPPSVAQLVAATPRLRCMPLADVVRLLPAGSGLHGIAWSSRVACSANFVRSVLGDGIGQHLRPVDALLVFAGGDVLCLSEREADALQRELLAGRASGSTDANPMLLSLPYVQLALREAAAGTPTPGLLLASLPGSAGGGRRADPQQLAQVLRERLAVTELVQVALFSGAVSYSGAAQLACLRQMVRGKREAVQELVSLRGRSGWLSRSDLDRAAADNEFPPSSVGR